jgi:hypothetical protein
VGGWYYTFPNGKAYGPYRSRDIETRWRRYRIIRRNPPEGKYVPRRLAWRHAAMDPFTGKGNRSEA